MNYIQMINRFWQCDLERCLSPNDTRLWFYLVHTCNSLGWKQPFGHSDRHLAAKLNMSVNTVRSSKNRLKQIGLLDFKAPANGSKAVEGQTKYWLTVSMVDTVDEANKSTVSKFDTHIDTVVDTVVDTVQGTVPDTNNKLNKTKEEFMYKPPDQFCLSRDLELPVTVLESAEYNQFSHTKNKNTDFIYENWRIFLSERMNDPPGKRMNYRSLGDITSYFLNWIRTKHPKINGAEKRASGSKTNGANELLSEIIRDRGFNR